MRTTFSLFAFSFFLVASPAVHAGQGIAIDSVSGADLQIGAGSTGTSVITVGAGEHVPAGSTYFNGAVLLGNANTVTACNTAVEGTMRYNYATHQVQFCNGSAWTAVGGVGLGINQAWNDVTASRAIGVNYTNNTASPIALSIFCWAPTANGYGGDMFVLVDGKWGDDVHSVNADGHLTIHTIVPSGSTYSLQGVSAMYKWLELR